MPIDPKIEAPTRKLLGHAIRGELDDLYALIVRIGPQAYEGVVALAIQASGYIAIQVSERWPLVADVRALAKRAARSPISQVTEDEIAACLWRVVLGSESPLEVFPGDERAALIPLFTAAVLLISYSALHKDQWAYLDSIWNSLDAAEAVEVAVAPAVMYLYARKHRRCSGHAP
jgi:hypothetical protein